MKFTMPAIAIHENGTATVTWDAGDGRMVSVFVPGDATVTVCSSPFSPEFPPVQFRTAAEPADPAEPEGDPIADRPIESILGLNNRQINACHRQFIKIVADLGEYTEKSLSFLWGISDRSAKEMVEALEAERQRVRAEKNLKKVQA